MWIQDEQVVAFSPIAICYGEPPLYERLFVLGLLILVIFALVRDSQLVFRLRKLRKFERCQPLEMEAWRELWGQSLLRCQLVSKLGILAFFVSLFVISVSMTEVFSDFGHQKVTGVGALLFGLSQKLPEFSFGMLVCSLLYGSGMFFESRLNRRKLAFEKVRNKSASVVDASPGELKV
ncbi:MAG TPA: hypothetical protein VG844_16210 [Terracidiphilus sp.]|nr:hypothetical protein [Terracidiphilus sp.]